MRHNVDIQVATTASQLPDEAALQQWVDATLAAVLAVTEAPRELTVRMVDKEESRMLNAQYRQKDKPTNVLSFPSDLPPELDIPLLGDLIICAPVVEEEAREQNKSLDAHWAHMVIHGTLHLLGYDHIEDSDAAVMEGLEVDILASLNYTNPYIVE